MEQLASLLIGALQVCTGSLATMTTRTAPIKEMTRGISQSYLPFDQDYVVAAGLQELLLGMGDGGKNLSENLGGVQTDFDPLETK